MSENEDKKHIIDGLVAFKPTTKTNPNFGRAGKVKFLVNDYVLEQTEYLAGLGLGIDEISLMLDISVSTFKKKRVKHQDLELALRRGRVKAQAKISNALFEKALEQKDTSAMIFFLKNRAPEKWSDRRKIDHTSSDGSVSIPTEIIIKSREVTNDNVNNISKDEKK